MLCSLVQSLLMEPSLADPRGRFIVRALPFRELIAPDLCGRGGTWVHRLTVRTKRVPTERRSSRPELERTTATM